MIKTYCDICKKEVEIKTLSMGKNTVDACLKCFNLYMKKTAELSAKCAKKFDEFNKEFINKYDNKKTKNQN